LCNQNVVLSGTRPAGIYGYGCAELLSL